MSETQRYVLTADVAQLEAALRTAVSSFGQIDEAAMRAASGIATVADQSVTGSKRIASSVSASARDFRKLADAHQRAGQAGDGYADSLEGIGRAARAAGFGELAEKASNAGRALALLGTGGGIAMGVAGALAAVAAAAIASYKAMDSTVQSAIAAEKQYRGVVEITEGQTKALRDAESSMKALDAATAAITIEMGSGLAPTLTGINDQLAALSLAFADTFDASLTEAAAGLAVMTVRTAGFGSVLDGLSWMTSGYADDVERLKRAQADTAAAEKYSAETAKRLAAAVGAGTDAYEKRIKLTMDAASASEFDAKQAEYSTATKIALLDEELRAMSTTAERAAAIVAEKAALDEALLLRQEEARQARIKADGEAAEAAKVALEKEGEAARRAAEEYTKLTAAIAAHNDEVVSRLEEAAKATLKFEEKQAAARWAQVEAAQEQQTALAAIGQSDVDNSAANSQRIADELAQRLIDQKAFLTSLAADGYSSIASLMNALGSLYEAGSKQAVAFFRAQQGMAIAQVVVDTAQAIAKAIALFGPPPSPAGIAAMAAATAIGAVQIATIASQKPPQAESGGSKKRGLPKHHLGTPVEYASSPMPSGYGAGDRYYNGSIVQTGEQILTPQQAREAGITINAVLQMDHRHFEVQAKTSLERGILRQARATHGYGQRRFQR